MIRRITAAALAVAAIVAGVSTLAASPAQALGHIINVADGGPYQDDIRADMAMTYNAGGGGNWHHYYSDIRCSNTPGASVSTAIAVSGGGPYEYMGVFPCNGVDHRSSLANNTTYSSARYFRYEFSSPDRGKYCLWIAPRSTPTTADGPC
jgi:hypothetical protein